MKEHRTEKHYSPLFFILLFFSLLLYLWIFSQTPYGQDDWAWGIDYGMRMLLTGGINSRYVGNLLEVIVTRSVFLKAVLPGLIAALIPFFMVVFVRTVTQPGQALRGKADRLPEAMLLLSNILLLTIPIDVWQETYGWIAGFSNYNLAIFFLSVFLVLVFRVILSENPHLSVPVILGYFIFSICIQLVLENMTVYIFLVDFLFLILVRKNKPARRLVLLMLVANAIGLAIMFSSSIYDSLVNTGNAVGGYRTLSFDIHDGIFNVFLVLNQRFVYFYPNNVFGNNWLICTLISILLFFLCGRGSRWVKYAVRIFAFFFALYFVFTRFCGPLEDYISRWNIVLTQWLNLLFFWGVLLSVILLPWEGTHLKRILIFIWLSVLGIVLPLVAVKIVGSRYFLFSSFFLVEFCLFLFADVYTHWHKQSRFIDYIVLFAFLFVGIHRFSIYYDIGQGKKEREALIRAAQNGETDRLYFTDLPHNEYIEINEPLDGSEHVRYFRKFYNLPDSVEMHNSLEDFSPEE